MVSGHHHPDDRTVRRPKKGDPEEGMNVPKKIKSRQPECADTFHSTNFMNCEEANFIGHLIMSHWVPKKAAVLCQRGHRKW